ncbi:MAG: glycosyltransferase, partial [Mariprofundales bacterium]
QIRNRYILSPSDILFISVGRIHPIKGLEVMCDAFKEVASSFNNIRLFIAGEGEAKYVNGLKTKYQSLINNQQLFFLGNIDGDDKSSLYQAADVYISTSWSENFGMSIAEAMLAGLPVILSNHCPWPQITEWGAGLMVDNKASAVADAMKLIIKDNNLRKNSGMNAKKHAQKYLSSENIANKMLNCYEFVMQKNKVV